MRGPSGVPLAKNVVSELALEAVVQDPKKRSGEGGFDNGGFSNQAFLSGGSRRSGFGSSDGFGYVFQNTLSLLTARLKR